MALKNSTLVTLPSASDAFAAIVTVAGALNLARIAGLVMLTDGTVLAGGSCAAALPPPIASTHACGTSPGAFQFSASL